MKLVKCIVRSDKVEETTDALKEIDVPSVTVTQVGGHGRKENPKGVWRCSEYEIRYLPQMMIDIVVDDHVVEDVVRTVMETAHTGRNGDGRVFIIPVEEAYSIRTRAWGSD